MRNSFAQNHPWIFCFALLGTSLAVYNILSNSTPLIAGVAILCWICAIVVLVMDGGKKR